MSWMSYLGRKKKRENFFPLSYTRLKVKLSVVKGTYFKTWKKRLLFVI